MPTPTFFGQNQILTGGGGGFDPGSFLAGLTWYADADNVAGVDNDPVVDLPNASGLDANINYGQDTGTRQPALKTGLYNGHNGIRFGGNDSLVHDPTALPLGSANTLICVCTPGTAASYIVRGNNSEGGPGFITGFGGVAFEYFYTTGGERATFAASASGLHILTLCRTDDTGNYVGYFDETQVFSNSINTGNDWNGQDVPILGSFDFNATIGAYTGDYVAAMHFNQNHAGASGLADLLAAAVAWWGI